MFRFEDRRQKLKGFFGHFVRPKTVEFKHGHSNVLSIGVFVPVNVVLFITLYTVVLVLDLYIKSYYGVNWHKLK